MGFNFPVFATGVRILRASNVVGPLFVGPGSTRILEKQTQGKKQNDGVLLNFLLLSISLISEKVNGWNALTLWAPSAVVPLVYCRIRTILHIYPPTICFQV